MKRRPPPKRRSEKPPEPRPHNMAPPMYSAPGHMGGQFEDAGYDPCMDAGHVRIQARSAVMSGNDLRVDRPLPIHCRRCDQHIEIPCRSDAEHLPDGTVRLNVHLDHDALQAHLNTHDED